MLFVVGLDCVLVLRGRFVQGELGGLCDVEVGGDARMSVTYYVSFSVGLQ